MFLQFFVEQYVEKQTEIEIHNTPYGEDDMLEHLKQGNMNIRKMDFHKTVLVKSLQKKGKVTVLDNGDVMLGKKQVQKNSSPAVEQGSLF